MSPLPSIEVLSNERRSNMTDKDKALWGQYFTSPPIASFMATLIDSASGGHVRILDPGAGTGILGAAAVSKALSRGAPSVHLVAVEQEPEAAKALRASLRMLANEYGEKLTFDVIEDDFLSAAQPSLIGKELPHDFDVVISNPPYFKMSPSKPRGGTAPNAYARFMDMASRLLRPGGEMVFIVPRSFASGLYFKQFRSCLRQRMTLEWVHIFGSRREAFKQDSVLQENVIVRYRRGTDPSPTVTMSTSNSPSDLDSLQVEEVPRDLVEPPNHPQSLVLFPASRREIRIVQRVRSWPSSLEAMDLRISTGPVVPFRTDTMIYDPNGQTVVPLLWMQHVKPGKIIWPKPGGMKKPEHILATAGPKLLVENSTYVLLRRFSAKEEARRLTVAVLKGGALPGKMIGLENHLNFIHRPGGTLDTAEALGLAAVLSSTLVDDYFRLANGNTQVNATDMRALPLPAGPTLRILGKRVESLGGHVLKTRDAVDALVGELM